MAKPLRDRQLRQKKEAFLAALEKHDLNILKACKASGLPRCTYYNLMGSSKDYKPDNEFIEAVNHLRSNWKEDILDLAESKLKASLKKGSERMIRFTLETIGKERGYVRRSEMTGADGSAMIAPQIVLSPPSPTDGDTET